MQGTINEGIEMNGSKIRLLHIAFNDLGHGGIQSQLMNVTEALRDEVQSDVIVWSNQPAFYDEDFLKYGRIFRIPHYEGSSEVRRRLDYYIRYYSIKHRVEHIIQKYGPYDVVHCYKFFECAPCMAAAKKCGVPIRIASSHNTEQPVAHKNFGYYVKKLYNNIYRTIIQKNATNMVGCSQAAADYLFGKGHGVPIYNGIDLSKFNPDLYDQVPHKGIHLVHVGKFCFQKNQLFLLDILQELLKTRKDVDLTLIGGGDAYYQKVLDKIEFLQLQKYVHLLPHDADVAQILAQSDFFVFPSTFEGFGNVLIEAQAMGLRCFVSTEVTPEADCGLLTYIPLAEGAEQWAKKIDACIRQDGVKKQKVDVTRFSIEACVQRWMKLYKGEA